MKIIKSYSDREDFYAKVLELIGVFSPEHLKIAPSEITLLTKFMTLPKEHRYYPFSPKARRLVAAMFPKKLSKQNISIKINSLLEKGYLFRDEDGFINYNPTLVTLMNKDTFDAALICRPLNNKDIKDDRSASVNSEEDYQLPV